MDSIRSALESEREELVRQLDELGATDQGNLSSDVEFPGSFAGRRRLRSALFQFLA